MRTNPNDRTLRVSDSLLVIERLLSTLAMVVSKEEEHDLAQVLWDTRADIEWACKEAERLGL